MTQYVQPPVETDPTALLQSAYDYLGQNIPGWVPNVANLDTWLLQAVIGAIAEARDVAANVPTSIFRYYGSLVGVPPLDAAAASVRVKFTAINTAGYTIPAGTQLGLLTADGVTYWPFATSTDAVIAPGGLTVDYVTAVATIVGAGGTALGTAGAGVLLIDPLAYIASVTQDEPSNNGVDAETDEAYLNRLSAELQLISPRPILPNDFSVLARTVAGVFRAAAIDGYDPTYATYGNQRMVTVALVDAAGNACNPSIKTAVKNYLESLREVNFIVNVMDPVTTQIQIVYTVQSVPGTERAVTKDAIDAALKNYLSPVSWGSTQEDPLTWRVETLVRFSHLSKIIDSMSGVDYITSLLAGPTPGALNNVDISLTGAAPLPSLLQININGAVL